MPTYLLDGSNQARITPGPLKVEIHASQGAGFVIRALADGQPAQSITPRPDIMVIPRVAGRILVSIATIDGISPFPQGTTLNVTVGVDGPPSADPERVVLAAVDVSGLTGQELLSLEPKDGFITVASFVGADNQMPLSGLAKAAQVAAREVLGTERVDETSAINIVVAIDGSASLLPATRDGSVKALAEVLAGISRVVSPGKHCAGAVVADDVQWIASDESELPAALEANLDARSLATSFRSSAPGLAGRYPDENTVTYVLTDSLPADMAELRAADGIDGEARHLVLVTDATALALEGETGIPTTRVDPAAAPGDVEARLADPRLLRALIVSLLQGCFVPGTPYAKRVAS